MSEDYRRIFADLKAANQLVQKGCVLDASGNILFTEGEWDLSSNGKQVLDAWLKHGPRIEVQGLGFSVLRSEPEALVGKNIAGKGNVFGSITKGGNYFIAFVGRQDETYQVVERHPARAELESEGTENSHDGQERFGIGRAAQEDAINTARYIG